MELRTLALSRSYCCALVVVLSVVLGAAADLLNTDGDRYSAATSGMARCANVTGADWSLQSASASISVFATIESHETGDGWDKYADEFEVRDAETGSLLGTRTLLHPHVNEQPFTRSLTGLIVPDEVRCLSVAARDSVLGYCGEEFKLCLFDKDETTTETKDQDSSDAANCAVLVNVFQYFVGFLISHAVQLVVG